MFDFSVYAAPAVVLAGIVVALIGFAVWGSQAIRESAEEAMAELAPRKKPILAPEVAVSGESEPDLQLDLPKADLERTAEFGQMVQPDAKPEVDFDAAIARITADLAAAEAAGEQAPLDLPAVDEDIEATRMLRADDRAAILSEVQDEAAKMAEPDEVDDIKESAENLTGDESISENDENLTDEPATDQTIDQAIEQTIIMPKLSDEEMDALPEDTNVLDKLALEETRVIAQELVDEEPAGPAFGEGAEDDPHQESLFPEAPVPFGPKMAWLAIPGYKPSEVISALRLGDVAPANWTKGLTQAYADNNQVFVTPALSGWVLVIGKTLWQKADMNRSAENIQWLKEVGRLFGNACFFSTMRGLGNHGWVGIRGGNIVRAYGYSGELQELIWLLGEPTEEEIAVNPGFANEVEERNQPDFRPVIPDEKMVLAMAAGWSVDVSFRNRQYLPDYGFVGNLE